MLRLGYMASDFHPKLLVLGEHAELGRVAGFLRAFAESGSDIRLVRDAGVAATATEVVLQEATTNDRPGLFAMKATTEKTELTWSLTRERASEFSDQVDALVGSSQRAGSVVLECGHRDEVKVVVSFGEWPDDFLVD